MNFGPRDEARHEPLSESAGDWREAWWFATEPPSVDRGPHIAVGLAVGPGHTEYSACAVIDSRIHVVHDSDVSEPKAPGMTLRADSLWAEFLCEAPLEHWTTALEAFGLRFDDVTEALTAPRGDRVAVGLDLEWEATGTPGSLDDGYQQSGTLIGEILIGKERMTLTAPGTRWHRWGPGVTLPLSNWLRHPA